MPMFPGTHLPRLDTACRTTSVATSVESHVLRDRFWDAFALDTGPGLDATPIRDNEAHGPSAYRGLNAFERLRHLGSALYPHDESVRETSSLATPNHSRELAERNDIIRELETSPRNGPETLVLPTAGPNNTAVVPKDGSAAQRRLVERAKDRPVPQADSHASELHRASMFLAHWATSLGSYVNTPVSSIPNEKYVQELDPATLDELFENVRYLQSDRPMGYGLPSELYDRPKSPKAKRPTADINVGLHETELMLPTIYEKRTTSSSDPAKKRWCGNWSHDSLMAFTFGSDCLRSLSR